ncbi:outer membrane protein assembly factor BamC [Paraneptunicella aestuarii]|uniref:outer membrane protein assembly factor BamC n=1 Tax=Paraneptunicella aestuarii TaxID=2831148 RepID=UPI001E4D7C62|nr:outer membrane protein assembly factor BamC [Paraneptunicella aestuarii]UAA40354.1 outer membrane protein assembly factor BamC [Paraneptunicella aestuarii]
MHKYALVCLGTISLLSACSTVETRHAASGGFDYLEEAKTTKLVIPENKDRPDFSDEYTLPALGEQAPRDLLGSKLSVQSPQLVLPLVTGSHITEGSREAVVWFDQVDDSQPLDETIWNSLLNFLDEQGIGVVSFDKDKQRLVSDWMVIENVEDSAWYSWTKTERSVGQRFEFQLDVKPHGRSAALKVELKDYLETVNDQVIAELDESTVRLKEIEILNSVISHYAKQIRIADARRLRQIQQGLKMELGFNADGDPAFMVDASYEIAWSRLLLVLRKMGFNVKDLDKSNGLLFVNYTGIDSGWWSGIWGGADELPLEKQEYRLKVVQQGEKTSITFQDSESKALSSQLVTDLFNPIAEVMATDDLDI